MAHQVSGDGDHEGDGDEQEEVAGQDEQQVSYGGAEDFADADLFCALDDVISGETEEAEAGDDDGEAGKETEYGAEAFVLDVLFVEVFVQEEIAEGVLRKVASPDGLYGGDRFEGYWRNLCGWNRNWMWTMAHQNGQRLDGSLEAFLVKILCDADNMDGADLILVPVQGLAE